jgi:DNA-directed RNA polymerase specialized sigma24 family protein
VLCSNILWDIPDTEYEETPVGLSMSVMAAFSEPEKETLRMRMEGLSFPEISAITGEPENRIRVRMHRLKKLLEEGARNRYKPKKVKV